LRREMQLRALRPDLVIQSIRGNLDTRLRKLDEGQFDAIVLAYAGLKRLQLEERVREVFGAEAMLPAAAQGVLGIEIATRHPQAAAIRECLECLRDEAALKAISAERAVLRALGGSCTMPIAAHCSRTADGWQLEARLGANGSTASFTTARGTAPAEARLSDLKALGVQIAEQLT
jgi:hydroxymethylbilane synthase